MANRDMRRVGVFLNLVSMGRAISDALQHYRARRFQSALEVLGPIHPEDPNWYKAEIIRGWVSFRMGEWQPAIDRFKSALLRRPNSPSALFGSFQALTDIGRFDEASVQLSNWLTVTNDLPRYYLHGSWLAFQQGRIDEALSLAELGTELAPRARRLQFWLGFCSISYPSKWPLAERALRRASRVNTFHQSRIAVRATLLRARMRICSGKIENAKPLLANVVSRDLRPERDFAIVYQYCLGLISDHQWHELAKENDSLSSATEIDGLSATTILSRWPLIIGTALSRKSPESLEARMCKTLDRAAADYYLHQLCFCDYIWRANGIAPAVMDGGQTSLHRMCTAKSDNYIMSCMSAYLRMSLGKIG